MTLDRRVAYDAIAVRYDRRHRESDYSGIESAMLAKARAARAEGRLDKSWTSQLSVLSDYEFAAGALRIEREIEAAAQCGEESMLYADLRLYATEGWVY